VATTALYASAFGSYAQTLLPASWSGGLVLRVLMVLGVALPWLVNLADASLVARTEGWIVGIKLTVLLVVVVAGARAVNVSTLAPSTWPSTGSLVAAAMLVFVAYEGFELIANASEDVTDPDRTLPRAFALSIGIVVVLYVLIAAVVVGSLTPSRIAAAEDFALAEAASTTLGGAGFTMVAVSAVLATLSAINATLYGAARLSYTLATEGELPERFDHLAWNQPVGLHLTALGGAAIGVALPLVSISGLASAIFLLVFASVNAAAARAPDAPVWRRALAVAGLLGCVGSLTVLLVASVSDDPVMVALLAVLLGGAFLAEDRILRHRRAGSVLARRGG
jgi:amino acid transporter